MASNNWEVVGRTSKKSKSQGSNGKAAGKKLTPDSMPKLKSAPPLEEEPTMFDAFLVKENKEEPKGSPKGAGDGHKKHGQQKKKQSNNQDKKPAVQSLEEAMKKLERSDLETLLTKDQATFPDNPSVWLKDLASMLNLQLDKVPDTNPIFEGKPLNYPLAILPKPVKELLVKTLLSCSTHTLELFIEHCIQSTINDISKNVPTFGYSIFLQLLAQLKPNLFLENMPKHLELLRTNQNRPLRCLAIMWAIGQVGTFNLSNGFKVWLELMLPFLNMRALSSFVVDYVVQLFEHHSKNLKQAYGVIDFRTFFPIHDIIYAQKNHLPTNLQKKLLGVYPTLKLVAIGGDPSSSLRTFFPSYLARALPGAHKPLRQELLRSLVDCLINDQHCYSVWRQMYTRHLLQSGVLLQHLVENWGRLKTTLEPKLLKETIRAFSITNDELSSQEKGGNDGYKHCIRHCKALLTKMTAPRFPWRILVYVVLAVCAALLTCDIYVSKGLQKSRTVRVLQEAGILAFLAQVWQRILLYGGRALIWLQDNVPHYYAKACEIAGPYLQLLWEKLYLLGIYIADVTKPQREWLNQKVPELLEWVQSKVPWVWEHLSYYLGIAWDFTLHYSLLLWQYTLHYSHIAGTWLQENVFIGKMSPENLQKTLSTSVAALQSYSSSVVTWCTQLVAGSNTAK